jgi:hypothetical protein
MVRGVLTVLAVSACGVGALSVLVQERAGAGGSTSAIIPAAVLEGMGSSSLTISRDAERLRGTAQAGDLELVSFAALPAGARQWRYLDDAARLSLARHVVPDHAFVQLSDGHSAIPLFCDIARVDARLFVECGLAHDAVLRDGQAYACIDPAAVLLNQRYDVLEWVLECAPEEQPHLEWGGLPLQLLRRLNQREQLESVREELIELVDSASRPYAHARGRSESLLMSALLLASEFEEADRLRALCEQIHQQPFPADVLLGAARIAKLVLLDDVFSRELMERAAAVDPSSSALAEAWLALFGDESSARAVLDLAMSKQESPGVNEAYVGALHSRSLGLSWWDLLGDRAQYLACTGRRGEDYPGALGRLCQSAQEMSRGLRFADDVPTLLAAAEGQARTASDWILCARFASDLVGDGEKVRVYLRNAEERAVRSEEWDLCGNLYLSRLQDAIKAGYCLDRAEAAARSSQDWVLCARLAARLGSQATRIGASLQAAEERAHTSRDWLNCAELAWYIFRDPEQSVVYLANAERANGFADSLVPIADLYLRLASEEERAMQLITMAEAHATDFRDWYGVAAFYVERLGEPRKGSEVLARAETLAVSPEEKALCLSLKERLRR